jgi:hypothetical protein
MPRTNDAPLYNNYIAMHALACGYGKVKTGVFDVINYFRIKYLAF